MTWLRTVLREVYGLFVDDLAFTLSLLAWVAFIWLALVWLASTGPALTWQNRYESLRLHTLAAWWLPAVLLFAGLAAILLESVLRYARAHARR